MLLKYLEKEEYFLWNNFVKGSPQGSIFSQSWYLDALQVKYKVLGVFDNNDKLIAGIVLAKNQINTFSNPMLDKYLGVLLKHEDKYSQKIISKQYKALELISKELIKYKSFDYYFHPNFKNWIPFYWNGFTQQTRYTYQIDLNKEIDEIYGGFHSKLKNDIKNAHKQGVIVKKDIEFDIFYKVIDKTFRRQGSKAPFNKESLEVFSMKVAENGRFTSFGALDLNSSLIAVLGLVYDERVSYLILNGIDIENQIRGANALMIFEAIKFIKAKNIPIFDFEGSMLPGVEQFYRRFGGELVPYYRIWQDNLFNYAKSYAKKMYKKMRYGR